MILFVMIVGTLALGGVALAAAYLLAGAQDGVAAYQQPDGTFGPYPITTPPRMIAKGGRQPPAPPPPPRSIDHLPDPPRGSGSGPRRATVVSDPADVQLLQWTYTFLRDLGRNLDVRGDDRFPERDWSQLYEAVGDRLYPSPTTQGDSDARREDEDEDRTDARRGPGALGPAEGDARRAR